MSDKLIQCPRCGDPITNELGDNPICGACALASELNVNTLQARIAELEEENAIFRAADYEALRAEKLIYCAKCRDGIVSDDDGICGVCAGAQDGVIESLQNMVADLKKSAIVWHKYPAEKPPKDKYILLFIISSNYPVRAAEGFISEIGLIYAVDGHGFRSIEHHELRGWAYLPEPPEVKQ